MNEWDLQGIEENEEIKKVGRKMKADYAILIVSHVEEMADGLKRLLDQITEKVQVYAVGGGQAGGIGTNYDKIADTVEKIEVKMILVFYDLGSARMNLRLLEANTEKKMRVYDVSFVEGAYLAATLLEIEGDLKLVEEKLETLKIRK